jgi:ligand-binding SRPBCC domain-containing protein
MVDDRPYLFEFQSRLVASPEDVWARVSTMAGVNDELWPMFRMTHPPGRERIDAQEVPLGVPVFRSTLLLGCVLPIDYDDLMFDEIDPGRRFVERSSMLSSRVWRHERRIDPRPGGGTIVTDRVDFEPRMAPLAPIMCVLVPRIFRHRHKRLRLRFKWARG